MNAIIEYINQYPDGIKERLIEIRNIILAVEPNLKEKISWGMPTFYLDKNIIHFASFKNHIGIYPGAQAVEAFKKELEEFKTSKGGIQIPNNQEIPTELIKKLVVYQLNTK